MRTMLHVEGLGLFIGTIGHHKVSSVLQGQLTLLTYPDVDALSKSTAMLIGILYSVKALNDII